MAGGMDWFRWHHGCVTDPKFQLVARKSGASLPDVLAVWAYVLEQASMNADRGSFGAVDAEALDCLFGFPATETRTGDILLAMEDRGLIANGRIAMWEARQPKREREEVTTSTARVQAHRAKKQDETPCNATERQETPRGEEKREEEKTSKSKAEASQRGSRLPADWNPTEEEILFCKTERPDLNAEVVAHCFRDFWVGKPGKDGRKTDWAATWRNWVRNEKVKTPAKSGGSAPWWSSDALILAKGAEMGMKPHNGEYMPSFKGRVQAAIDNGGKPPPPPRSNITTFAADEKEYVKPSDVPPLKSFLKPREAA